MPIMRIRNGANITDKEKAEIFTSLDVPLKRLFAYEIKCIYYQIQQRQYFHYIPTLSISKSFQCSINPASLRLLKDIV